MKILNKNKGSTTIEASIVIPIIVIAMLSVLFLIKIAYIHYSVQMALDSAVNEVGHYAYLYKKTGIFDEVQDNKGNTSVISDATALATEIETISNEFLEIKSQMVKDSQKPLYEGESIFEKLNYYIDETKRKSEQIISVSQGVTSLFKEIRGFTAKDLYQQMLSEYADDFEKTVLDYSIRQLSERNLDESVTSFIYSIDDSPVRGVKAFDMSLSNYFEEDNDYKLDVVVIYKVKNPLPFDFLGDIKLMNRVVVSPWIGEIK